ncbi:uncharacterized protein HD556DRAFT_1312142 [Suillus plorans]|uniref:Uncharacterized protein n=1 Tax=Suillus plorans TaxID=116603 RepID=A0A9P7AFD1_9AGAM|nr:uncharacterized protein HD556DRAFT_1312142 [Suillus plorans]KAG1788184.1 hypothetical protein HD556DRAFT_1312142 [Suillus plorans]
MELTVVEPSFKPGAGKSFLLLRFADDMYTESYISPIGMSLLPFSSSTSQTTRTLRVISALLSYLLLHFADDTYTESYISPIGMSLLPFSSSASQTTRTLRVISALLSYLLLCFADDTYTESYFSIIGTLLLPFSSSASQTTHTLRVISALLVLDGKRSGPPRCQTFCFALRSISFSCAIILYGRARLVAKPSALLCQLFP